MKLNPTRHMPLVTATLAWIASPVLAQDLSPIQTVLSQSIILFPSMSDFGISRFKKLLAGSNKYEH